MTKKKKTTILWSMLILMIVTITIISGFNFVFSLQSLLEKSFKISRIYLTKDPFWLISTLILSLLSFIIIAISYSKRNNEPET